MRQYMLNGALAGALGAVICLLGITAMAEVKRGASAVGPRLDPTTSSIHRQ